MKCKIIFWLTIVVAISACSNSEQSNSGYEIEYTNPILHMDYSDPDVVKVGEKFYMTASSFNCVPGLPLLESENLVDWKLVGYAIKELELTDTFSKPQHGNGVWAPAIRYHNNQFYIYYGDPDFGIYMLTAPDIKGPWTKPYLVKAGKGWIDPCPFWDDNGSAWLVHAWAASRAGIKSTLTLHKMSPDGKSLLDNGAIIFDGHIGNPTVEGPKMYKRKGFYYVFAPAGGVTEGWQLVLRSKNVLGPYKAKKVLHQGITSINGPHQGAWVDNFDGTSWFYHFQDKGAYGRIVHLQPMTWNDNWPVIGIDEDGDGCGEPVVAAVVKSQTPKQEVDKTIFSDEFNSPKLNLHWQWHANPTAKYGAPTGYLGFLRLNAIPVTLEKSLWEAPNLLLQKFPAEEFECSTKIDLNLHESGDKTGLIVMGYDYAYVGIEKVDKENYLVYKVCSNADKGGVENTIHSQPYTQESIYLKLAVNKDVKCNFYFSADGKEYTALNQKFTALPGKWIGAKVGLFCIGKQKTNNAGYVNVDWFRVNYTNTNI